MLRPYMQKGRIEAGCDEAGRGCLAGPVCAAAVILPDGFTNADINDSKQLSPQKRQQLRLLIEQTALAWAVVMIPPQTIDKINILQASVLGMNQAVEQLKIKPEHLLIDGNKFNSHQHIPYTCVIKGDATYLSIAAASILAKTHRDEYMENLATEFPQYGWDGNKGYPTAMHRKAIQEYGITIHHRKSFTLIPQQLKLSF
ncbi:MAG: ribonuclease HII [Bacteroidales bacterium]|nr:ribonuclease HII [Bacteroidales bacterium]